MIRMNRLHTTGQRSDQTHIYTSGCARRHRRKTSFIDLNMGSFQLNDVTNLNDTPENII